MHRRVLRVSARDACVHRMHHPMRDAEKTQRCDDHYRHDRHWHGRHRHDHHFPDGEIVLVTRLYPGQHATVLQLPALPSGVNDREQPSHAAAE